tara:strand:- start:158 stop:1732 length:1575 start_codon:yes stop_codon:yes gene_type:complete
MTKYIFVTGGVISGLGKGVTSASIGAILQMLGYNKIIIKKLDPYLNVDPGTMNPVEHGEVFVTRDGQETDLDLGYYERFLGTPTTEINSTSYGKLFRRLIHRERNGQYLGKTVQLIPHLTDLIQEFIKDQSSKYDVIICEIGGSIGDIEAMAFYEAIRQMKSDDTIFIHLTYLLYYPITDELKTKPTQNAIRELQQAGITPDLLLCRTEREIPSHIKDKLSLHTNLPITHIIQNHNLESIYQVPLSFISQNVHKVLSEKLQCADQLNESLIQQWSSLEQKIGSLKKTIQIGILGKYTSLNDSYKSLLEALCHAGLYHECKIEIKWLNAREDNCLSSLKEVQGVIIPGGFGDTGVETMIECIRFLRESKIPTFGICLGMQLQTIEFCRNVLGMARAGSSEFENCSPNVISKMKEWSSESYGGTMRLGSAKIKLNENSRVRAIYQQEYISERHRHRYDVNNIYSLKLVSKGLNITGRCVEHELIEIIELKEQDHPWYIGVQFHPEYESSPFNPHPLFVSFIQRCSN